jgi:hypothetical protein
MAFSSDMLQCGQDPLASLVNSERFDERARSGLGGSAGLEPKSER